MKLKLLLAALAIFAIGLGITAPWAEPDITDIPELRRLADRGDIEAQRLVFEAYLVTPRGDLGPRDSTDRLFSRAEAEAALRAAAKAGDVRSAMLLSTFLLSGTHVLRDADAALAVLDPVVAAGGDMADPAAALRAYHAALLPGATAETRAKIVAVLTGPSVKENDDAKVLAARVLMGGDAADQAEARKLLGTVDPAQDPEGGAILGEMLVRGMGGPADITQGLALLTEAQARGNPLAGRYLGQHYLDGVLIGPDPQKAIQLMARYALEDFDTRQMLGEMLIKHHRVLELPEAKALYYAFREDEDAGAPGAAWLLIRLLDERMELFRGDTVIIEVMWRNAKTDNAVAVYKAHYEGVYAKTETEAAATRATLDALAAKGLPSALIAKGHLLQIGAAYPQDSVGAFEAYLQAAKLGDPDGMIALAKAYSDGLGTDRDQGLQLEWLRRAADLGSIKAEATLTSVFRFGGNVTLREGVTNAVRLWAGGSRSIDFMKVEDALQSAIRLGFPLDDIRQAFMDGLRAGPAALDAAGLSYIQKNTPREFWQAVEQALIESGHYKGEATGFFRPEAREALKAWVAEMGPLPKD
jgi:TPR repeat protein